MAQAPAPGAAPAPGTTPAPGAAPAPGKAPAPGTVPAPGGTTPGTAAAPPPVQATLCIPNVFIPTTVPLKQLKTTLGTGGSVTVAGTVTIIDGCAFTINGFTYSTAATNSYWMGSNSTDPNSEKILVSNTPVGQFISQPAVRFNLTPTITFDDFNVLDLYSFDEKAVFGQAVLRTPKSSETKPSASAPTSIILGDATRLSMNPNIMTIITIVLVAFFFY
ncbi:hypothetical protein C1646_661883 [Rhizophagus diaphanus]|nr:hypothetical protein C1646_661883 [Rhizophagus diaphanus] [Rhizophagus sp. MUCL 43196]